MNQTGPRALQEASECRVDRHCECLSIHPSGTNSAVRSNARGAGQRRVAPRATPVARFGCCHCIAVVCIQEPGAIQKVGGAHHRNAAPLGRRIIASLANSGRACRKRNNGLKAGDTFNGLSWFAQRSDRLPDINSFCQTIGRGRERTILAD